MVQFSIQGLPRALRAALLVAGICALPAAHAQDGTITVTGDISGTTCKISGNSTGGPNFTVALPEIVASSLGSAGTRTGDTPFNIMLTNCQPGSGNVSTYFEPGTTVNAATGQLKNASGTAQNVEVGLLNKDRSVIKLGVGHPSQNTAKVAIASGSAKLEYIAQYVATGGAAGSGSVNTSVLYSLVYQ
ncbi:type 1 fimbrial protein [Burkholderia multivorans]|uniref:fimbrial protein n=1 Tax=Burkholderia multivorans TaxID=87883 RepID=UPI0008412630|nr:fimbrial protein [Burkholderia multivorans]AOJ94271.1 fimbrial protein [Burkholderia multivorans]MBU9241980.1 type 1 fimbrial protein [Burkholderia multivorans]MCA8503248.1 type 1 fimbrial protein [Burkholderia multivorans]MCO1344164.1 type 1 fimbrial protein [Burkholderia multivorans]MCO1444626.1 type 1 fimbrial protein [Burkholderia multivorans]